MSNNIITFFPGPSQVWPQLGTYMSDAFESGLLSQSHRSPVFTSLMQDTVAKLKASLDIPTDYNVYFTSSATENWEIIAQSFTKQKSTHFYSGAFGQRWFEYASYLKPQSNHVQLTPNQAPNPNHSAIDNQTEIIALTQNETSNGTQVNPEHIKAFRQAHPNKLLALDVVSSLGGIQLPIALGDLWYASVQKCFGLPAGLGILIASPQAVAKGLATDAGGHYNSFANIHKQMLKYQTNYTPNVLAIYLLNRVLDNIGTAAQQGQQTQNRCAVLENAIKKSQNLSLLVTEPTMRSTTVITVSASPQQVEICKKEALNQNLRLGNGYGNLKNNTFRIANFPAIPQQAFDKLTQLINSW